MDALRQWALCLIIAAAAGTFVISVSPRGSMDKTVRAVVGIFVVAAICSPLADLIKSDFTVEAMADYEYEADDGAEDLQEYMLSVCREAAEEKIISAAEESGVSVEEIFINADIDADNCIIIHGITVTVSAETSDKSAGFSAILEETLGVPVTVTTEQGTVF